MESVDITVLETEKFKPEEIGMELDKIILFVSFACLLKYLKVKYTFFFKSNILTQNRIKHN